MKSEFRDWSDLRVFLAVVRAGSTLAASKGLGMAQPTVARRIEALEHALGLVLFERDTRGFQPTPEAQALIGEAEAVERAAQDLAVKAARLIAGRSRTIRITAFRTAFNRRFSSVIEAFLGSHADVRFEFLPTDATVDIAAGEADIAIRYAHRIDDPSLICRKIRDISFAMFASEGYAARHPLPQSETAFGGHRFVVYGGRRAGIPANQWLLARIDPTQVVMESDEMRALETAVLLGTGMGVFPTPVGREHDSLIQCLELPPETAYAIWLLVNPAAYRRPEVKAFTAFFVPRYRAKFAKGAGAAQPNR